MDINWRTAVDWSINGHSASKERGFSTLSELLCKAGVVPLCIEWRLTTYVVDGITAVNGGSHLHFHRAFHSGFKVYQFVNSKPERLLHSKLCSAKFRSIFTGMPSLQFRCWSVVTDIAAHTHFSSTPTSS